MQKPIRAVPYQHPRYTHRVRIFDGEGKRKDHYFTNETEALSFAKSQNTEKGKLGTDFGYVAEDERAALAFWRQFLKEADPSPPNLLSVMQSFKVTWMASRSSLSVREAVDRFIVHQEGVDASQRHLASLRSRLGRFVADHGSSLVSEVTTETFTEWLNGVRATRADRSGEKLSPVTRHNLSRTLRSFFTFSIEREWALSNPVPLAKRSKNRSAKLANRTAPAVMLPVDVARFMSALQTEAPGLVAFWAFKFFAGIRDAEAAGMRWEMIDMKKGEIHIPASLSKTADQRTVKIRPNLAAWVRPYVKESGKIAPADSTRKRGFKLAMAILPGLVFPSNAARHSFGTYHLYKFRRAGETALQLGHKGNPAMLHEHYKNPTAEKHAAAFWNVIPEETSNVTPMHAGRRTA